MPRSNLEMRAKYGRERRAKLKESNLCQSCSVTPLGNRKSRCESCHEKHLKDTCDRRLRRREAGLCQNCERVALLNTNTCLEHWLKAMATDHLGNVKNWKLLLKKLEDQDYKCPYLGELLIPGVNINLDHIVPTSRGGSTTDINNLQWTSKLANFMKTYLTHEEFIEKCTIIASRFAISK